VSILPYFQLYISQVTGITNPAMFKMQHQEQYTKVPRLESDGRDERYVDSEVVLPRWMNGVQRYTRHADNIWRKTATKIVIYFTIAAGVLFVLYSQTYALSTPLSFPKY